jgi:hypothetical protein
MFELHDGLLQGSRLRGVIADREQSHAVDIAFLALCGMVAALSSAYLDFRLRIPGHAILRAVFPMALGLAVVPRRGAGSVMGISALCTGLFLRWAVPAGGLGIGALTSLALTGPLLDVSLRRAEGGWRLYSGFAVAGLAANLAAFVLRGGVRYAGLDHPGARAIPHRLVSDGMSYVVCGIVAGVISGVIWFQATRARSRDEGGSA